MRPEDWWELGAKLMKGTPPSTVRQQHGIAKPQTLANAIERFRTTGKLQPPPPAGGKGKVRRGCRKTSQMQDMGISQRINEGRGSELESTAWEAKVDMGLADVGLRTIQRRANEGWGLEFGMRRIKLTQCEPFSPADRALRYQYGVDYIHWTVHDWLKVLFLDEHYIVYSGGKTASRQVHAQKRFGWGCFDKVTKKRLPGDKWDPKNCKPSKSRLSGGKMMKFACGVVGGKPVTNEPVQKYIEKRGPSKPKPVKYSKNGKVLGRKRKGATEANPEGVVKDKGFDSEAYCLFLEEVLPATRKQLKLHEDEILYVVQDNWSAHFESECKKVLAKYNCECLPLPPRSPGLNVIENMFGMATKLLNKLTITNPPKSPEEKMQHFRDVCNTLGVKGHLKACTESMPRRLKQCIDRRGAAIDA